ncbi:MAG: zinc-ribbon domain-containing protein, partial [Thermomicrobiales bacterium]
VKVSAQPQRPKFCAECGTHLHERAKFCTVCGTRIEP